MKAKPETTAHVSVKEYCFTKKEVKGVVEASDFKSVSYTHLTLPTIYSV